MASNDTVLNQIVLGSGTWQDYQCTGDITCNGHMGQECLYWTGPNFTIYRMYCVSGCDGTPSGTVKDYEYYGGAWHEVCSVNWSGGYSGYIYDSVGWSGWSSNGHQMKTEFNGTTRYWYINYYTLTVNVKDLLGNNMPGIDVYVDGDYKGITGTPGNVDVAVGGGNHTINLVVTSSWLCSGYPFDNWSPTHCSWTVNVTGNQTAYCTVCMTNDCRYYHHIIYDPYHNPSSGPTTLCVGCNPDSYPCSSGRWITGPSAYGAYISLEQIYDENPKRVRFCYNWPWGNEIECSYEEDMYANSWSSIHSDPTYGHFQFSIGNIWASGNTWWVKIEHVCWYPRPNLGTISDIDKSLVYVDCANGDDTNSGLCGFANAVKTITKAQTIIANNGTIYVKYGNCLNEVLSAVLNPLVNVVHISPRLNDNTVGTGNVVISGT